MDLSVKEAAALLGKSPRTVRLMIQQGRIVARRDGQQWRIDRDRLVGVDAERAEARSSELSQIRDHLDGAIEAVQPPAERPRRSFYSVRDVTAFSAAASVLAELDDFPADAIEPARTHLQAFLRCIADAVHQFHPEQKIPRFVEARRLACEALADLVVARGRSDAAALEPLADRVERDVLGPLRGLIRSAERRARAS